MSLSCKLKVLTLNVWGIRYVSKDVSLRYNEIIKALLNDDFDIIALQEVWSQKDFNNLRSKLFSKYPFSNYFHSGLIGSGCCLFSKHPIVEVFQSRYSLNGIPHKIQHGDWFGGKSVGLAKVKFHNNILINVYVTHLHANYASKLESNDEYLAHRISQAFELSQFLTNTRNSADVCLLMGDLNLEPHELGFKILRDNACLLDSYKESKETNGFKGESIGATCYAPFNSYTSNKDKRVYPCGIRIDHILYNCAEHLRMECLSCVQCLGSIPGMNISYSDHEAVSAQFLIESDNDRTASRSSLQATNANFKMHNDFSQLKNELIESFDIINKSMKSIYKEQIAYTILFFVFFLLLFFFNEQKFIALFKNIFSLVLCVFCVWFGLFYKTIEKAHLRSIKTSMEFILKYRYNVPTKDDEHEN